MKEIWKDVPLFEGLYSVSNYGKVKSLIKNKEIGFIGKDNYIKVSLYNNGTILSTHSHHLVARLFVSNPDNKPCVNHKDFNRRNNRADNLEWVTHAENTHYSKNNLFLKKGLKGESHPRSMFTNKQYFEMAILRNNGMKYSEIAKIYNAKQNTILQIFRRGGYV
jgi:hypothetical protein